MVCITTNGTSHSVSIAANKTSHENKKLNFVYFLSFSVATKPINRSNEYYVFASTTRNIYIFFAVWHSDKNASWTKLMSRVDSLFFSPIFFSCFFYSALFFWLLFFRLQSSFLIKSTRGFAPIKIILNGFDFFFGVLVFKKLLRRITCGTNIMLRAVVFLIRFFA